MNFSPLDIIIIGILLIFTLSGLKNKFIRSIKTTFNLVVSIILSNLLLNNIKVMNVFSHQNEILGLCIFLITLIILSLAIGFLLDFAIYQLEDPDLDPIADKALGALIGLVKGFVITALLIFVFDTTPLTIDMKDKITTKLSKESFFFSPCDNLKSILLK